MSKNQIQEPPYEAHVIEKKWQKRWNEKKCWEVTEDPKKKKYYVLDMFPYPSGKLHMGHVRNYALGDVIARIRRSQGYNVLHPMGWDAFGLPAENAAIKNKVHPEKWTLENTQTMKAQLNSIGIGYDWSREITTCLPEYYRWEQKIFIEMFEKDLAYKRASTVNWCPSCQTVLANEQVEDGKCWRCDSETTTKELEQWFLRITNYAEELLEGLDTLEGWPDRVKTMQRNWIGKSVGSTIQFGLENGESIEIFTTRPDTLMGVTFMAVAPEHPLALSLSKNKKQEKEVAQFIEKCRKEDKFERAAENAPKEGVFTGSHAIHPITQDKIPVYVANFVLMDYGSGALMAVPAHDTRDHAFAKKYKIPIKQVIEPNGGLKTPIEEQAYVEPGKLIHSGEFDGLPSEEAKTKITQALEKKGKGKATVTYKLRDWGLSRQRFWGAPIPMIHCPNGHTVPVPKEELPVMLPKDVEITGAGGSPLAHHPDFAKVVCPKCKNPDAKRETDTMDTFMESSWYYLRYLSPHDDTQPFDKKAAEYWLGIDQYIGGVEHATMHLLYFRFYHRVLRDLGYLPQSLDSQDLNEPARRLFNQGIVYKDGAKMSKSKGNAVSSDELIERLGADTGRVFSMFAAPPDKILEWQDTGVEGSYRFLSRIWRIVHRNLDPLKESKPFQGNHDSIQSQAAKKLRSKTHQTIDKAKKDFESGYHFNTMIAACMELTNEIYAYPESDQRTEEETSVLRESINALISLMNPFAPHLTEELWEQLGETEWLIDRPQPEADLKALVQDQISFVVQVNGKLRGNLSVSPDLPKEKVTQMAQEDAKVKKHLEGKTIVKTVFVPKRLINFVVK